MDRGWHGSDGFSLIVFRGLERTGPSFHMNRSQEATLLNPRQSAASAKSAFHSHHWRESTNNKLCVTDRMKSCPTKAGAATVQQAPKSAPAREMNPCNDGALMKPLTLVAVLSLVASPILAQEESVNPGINKSFENPDVEKFVERFEREGRDAFDHREEIIEAMQLKPGMAVADIGAGTGLFTRLFGKEVTEEGTVYAVDIAEAFVKHVELSAEEAGLENVIGVVCDADSVKLPPESIDLAFICDTYHHFEFPAKTMQSIHRALKPGGQIVLIDFHRIEGVSREWTLNHVRAGKEVFVEEITRAGFRVVEEKPDMLDESYYVLFEKVAAGVDE